MPHVPFLKTRFGVAFCILATVALFFLITEHRDHLSQAVPYLIFLLCPAMHLFMHHGHHHSHGSNANTKDNAEQ